MTWNLQIGHHMHELEVDEVLFFHTSSINCRYFENWMIKCNTFLKSGYKHLHNGAFTLD